MDKKEIIKNLKQWGISKSSGMLGYEAAKGILVYRCTTEEYERRMTVVADYLRI
jgi:hypothetical protein